MPLLLVALSIVLAGCSGFREEDIRFHNGAVTLAGTLYVPPGKGPHPALVFVHGDGPDTRDGYRFFAELFARQGVAALIYDKRGTGASTGASWQAPFSDLADDARAAVQFLKHRADIRAGRIGMWGGSQGGWIAPLAASRSEDVGFLIVKSGPAVGPAPLAIYKGVNRVRSGGFPRHVIQQVTDLMHLQFDILRTGTGWEQLESAVQRVKGEPWYRHVAVMRHSTWDSSWMTYGPDIDFDPVPVLQQLDIPVLFLLGELDPETPVADTVAILERIRKTDQKDFTVRVFPGADHQIELPRQAAGRPRYAPGYLDTMVDWTLDKVKSSRLE